ncbi:MAG: XRE family transcriptional regulator [Rhodobacteraceae bacterium PARR1]|nr:MAG: XRE family transcriptional regulator [Rhodobacteraceae bacterium PARR1]
MPVPLAGSRLRERRLALGLKQAEVAKVAGVSASYLNLIEHNRRRIAGDGLTRLAAALGLPLAALVEGADSALIDDLRSAAAAAAAEGAEAEADRAEEFAGRFPGWAMATATLARRAARLDQAVQVLNDKLSLDPHLSASIHEVLSAVSSVRSTAAILAETEDIDPEWRARFHRNLHQDSERLAAGAEALVAYLDASAAPQEATSLSPQEEVEAWLQDRDWHLDGARGMDLSQLATTAARTLAQDWIATMAEDAADLPQDRLAEAEARLGPDPLRLAAAFGTDPLQVMRRMALRPGSRLGLVICDGSGTLTFRKPADGFAIPRFGAACPLWPLYTALGRPAQPVEAVVATAGRLSRRFGIRAWCRPTHPGGFTGPELRTAAMLIQPLAAHEGGAGLPVGPTCRICPAQGCSARREPSILTDAEG